MNLLKEHLAFFRQFRERFETTGAVAPSSQFLARAMAKPLIARDRPIRVLEVGPGTGAVTRQIVRHLKPLDRFDLVEINDEFASLLRQRFAHDAGFQAADVEPQVHCLPLEEFSPDEPFDVIISGLPFNNFPAPLVESLLDRCLGLLAPGGEMAFFEYMFVRPFRRVVSPPQTRQRLGEIERILQTRFASYRTRTDWVFPNMPPAWVQHLQKPFAVDSSDPQ